MDIEHVERELALPLVAAFQADHSNGSIPQILRSANRDAPGIALRSARKVKSVPIRTAKDLRDVAATVETLDPQGERGDGALTLNVLNVSGDIMAG